MVKAGADMLRSSIGFEGIVRYGIGAHHAAGLRRTDGAKDTKERKARH
jgi:hypothetical protein